MFNILLTQNFLMVVYLIIHLVKNVNVHYIFHFYILINHSIKLFVQMAQDILHTLF